MSLRIIAGAFKGRPIKAPKTDSTRPTQGMLREAVFNICQNEIEGAAFLDLFAGSGAMAFEALSRGAASVVMIEQNKQAILCIKENSKTFQVEDRSQILNMDAFRAIKEMTKQGLLFDLVYVDPPYDMAVDLDLLAPIVKKSGQIFLEERRDSKKKEPVRSYTCFQLKKSKVFGIALLSIFDKL